MLLQLLIVVIIVGAVLLILQKVPLDERVKSIGTIVVIAVLAIWAMKVLLGGGARGLL